MGKHHDKDKVFGDVGARLALAFAERPLRVPSHVAEEEALLVPLLRATLPQWIEREGCQNSAKRNIC